MTGPGSHLDAGGGGWLARAPDPERAASLAGALLAALPPQEVARIEREHPDALQRLLLGVCGVAPFFAPRLRRDPQQALDLLQEDLGRPLSPAELEARLERRIATGSELDEDLLRRFKYYELARITVRDCSPGLLPLEHSNETLCELSQLADLLLRRSLDLALARVEARLGKPAWRLAREPEGPARPLAFCVIALGKLGGGELNFSSDVDLVYVHESPAGELADDALQLHPAEYFTRLTHAFGQVVTAHTTQGFLYRIDLELRPSGAQGPAVIGSDAFASYYELWADTWEKATFTKARPVAGDLAFGWRTIRNIDPMIYRSSMDYSAVRSIRELKDKFESAHGEGSAGGFDVKLDRGGIREVEFVAQAMQLLHAARIPQLRTRSTRETLEQLARVGLVARAQALDLARDYLWLRRLENRLQMEAEAQVHSLPRDAAGRSRLARALGHVGPDALARFEAELDACRRRVHDAYQAVLADTGVDGGVEGVLDVFVRGAPKLVSFPASRRMVEELAARFARAIDETGERERALNNLDRFVKGIGGRRFYYELLLDRPELVPRLALMFATSKFLSGYVASHPRLIEPIFEDPELLLLDRDALRAELRELAAPTADPERDPVDVRLDGLRLFHHRHVVNVGLLDLAELVSTADAQAALSDVAELCVEDALDFARQQLAARVPPGRAAPDRYTVIAMGKLATRELTYGSDLDLIFLFDAKGADGEVDLAAQDYFVRLTQRLISALQTPTTEGTCYEIDARLRPSGNQGTLVTSIDAFARYHETSAQTWERQALLRARPIAGDPGLGGMFRRLRLEILSRPLPADALAEIDRIRHRMETELAHETDARRNFKTGLGGVLDVESVVQALQLLHGARNPELFEVTTTETQIGHLGRLGLLAPESARALLDGWHFLGRLATRLRIVDNRSISDLDQERGDLEGIARRLGYASRGREGEAKRALLTDYERHTRAIRAEYQKLFQNV